MYIKNKCYLSIRIKEEQRCFCVDRRTAVTLRVFRNALAFLLYNLQLLATSNSNGSTFADDLIKFRLTTPKWYQKL